MVVTAGQRRRRGSGRPGRVTLATAVAAAALLLAACGGSPAGSGATTSTGATTSSTPTGSTEAPSGAAATAAVKNAYSVLFDLANPALAPKLAVVQDGSALSSTMATELKSAVAKAAVGAAVKSVTIEPASGCGLIGLSSPCATVRYDVMGKNGKPLLSNSQGYALYAGGRWLVAKVTICGLLSLASGGGGTPAGC